MSSTVSSNGISGSGNLDAWEWFEDHADEMIRVWWTGSYRLFNLTLPIYDAGKVGLALLAVAGNCADITQVNATHDQLGVVFANGREAEAIEA
ncbi:MAG: hypothetical protein ACXVS6_22700 [Solirubrobacteraceae bacterium]